MHYATLMALTGGISVVGNVFTVSDSQTFYTAGNLSPTITISDAAQSVTASAAVSVDLSTISLTPGSPTATAYQSFSGNVGTLADNAGSCSIAGNLAASVTLGDTTYPLTLASGGGGEYSLIVSNLPALSPGTYTAYLYAQEVSGTLAEPTPPDPLSITVQDPGINPTAVSFHAYAGVPWSGAIANFTHADLGDASNFTASTDWGDATSSSGTIAVSGGGYTVSDTHTYSTPQTYSPVTTVTDSYGTSAPVTSTATVDIASLSLDTTSFSLVEGQPFDGAIATLADAAGQYANPANYSATFMIGGVTYPVSLTPDYPADGLATVNVSLPAFSPVSTWGALNITETIDAHSVSATGTVPINVADIAPAVFTSAWSGPAAPNTLIATFTDADPNATANSFTATVNYDDGSQNAATITYSTNYIGQRTYFVYAGPNTHASVPNSTPFVSVGDQYGLSASAAFAGSDLQAPTGFAAVANGPQEVDLSWIGGMGPIFVSRTLSDGTGLTTLGPIQMSSGGYYADATVSDTTGYVYTIWADDGFGSSNSVTATVTTPSSGLTNLVLQDTLSGGEGVDILTWGACETGGTITITRTPSFPGDGSIILNDSANSYLDAGVMYAASYTYTIVTTKNGRTEPPSTVSGTTPLPEPTNLQTTTVQSGEVDLAWTDPSGVSPAFTIERTGGTGGTVAFSGITDASYQDLTAVDGTTYTYTVIASLNGVNSADSNAVSVTTPLAAPSGIIPTVVSTNEIDLAWTNNSLISNSFYVYRSTDGLTFSLLTTSPVSGATYADATVVDGTHYWYEAKAAYNGGTSDFSPSADCWTLPAAPTNLNPVEVDANRVALSWTNNSVGATSFTIERLDPGSTTYVFVQTVDAFPGTNTCSDWSVEANTAYQYRVVAIAPNGGRSAVSDSGTTSVNTPVASLAGLSASDVSVTEVDLSWTAVLAGVSAIEVDYSTDGTNFTAATTSLAADSSSYAVTALSANTSYWFRVGGIDPSGPTTFSVATASTPAVISNLAATAISASEIDLSWNLDVTDVTTIEISRSLDGVNFGPIGTLYGNATSYADADPSMTENTHYWYKVSVNEPGGPSASLVTDGFSLADISGLTATSPSSEEVDLSWTLNTAYATNLEVDRSSDGVNFSPITTALAANATGYQDVNPYLTENTQYWYRVSAIGANGQSLYCTAAQWTLPAVSSLTASGVSTSQINLNWTNNSNAITAVNVYRSTDPGDLGDGTNFMLLTQLSGAPTQYNDTSP